MYLSSSCIVRTRIRVCGSASRIWRVASKPESLGIERSITTTSGLVSSALRVASAPSPASPTTSIPSLSRRIRTIPSRTIVWSSATSTRTGSLVSIRRLRTRRARDGDHHPDRTDVVHPGAAARNLDRSVDGPAEPDLSGRPREGREVRGVVRHQRAVTGEEGSVRRDTGIAVGERGIAFVQLNGLPGLASIHADLHIGAVVSVVAAFGEIRQIEG